MITRFSSPNESRVPRIPDKSECAQLPPRVKLQAIVGIERVIAPLWFSGFVAFATGLILGPGRKSLGTISGETSHVISFGLGGLLVVSAALVWLLFDNYYVLECASGNIWIHEGFRFSGKETILLPAGGVIALGLNCRARRGKYSQLGWDYIPVLLTKLGRDIELSRLMAGMDCRELPEYNSRTRSWAAALGCYWIECPPQQVFRAREQFESFVGRASRN